MTNKRDQQALALAGILQAASLVNQLAQRGLSSQNNLETSLASLFCFSPVTIEDIFGGVQDIPFSLSLGIKGLQDIVQRTTDPKTADTMRYAISAMHLERKLSKRPDLLDKISKGLQDIDRKAHYFFHSQVEHLAEDDSTIVTLNTLPASAYCHKNVIAALDQLYVDTLGTFRFRIQVKGNPTILKNQDTAAKIRALLLAAIRSSMLWRQVGGQRWHLIFIKSRLTPCIPRLLNSNSR